MKRSIDELNNIDRYFNDSQLSTLNRLNELDEQLSARIDSVRRLQSFKAIENGDISICSKVMRLFIHHSYTPTNESDKGTFVLTVEGQLLDNNNIYSTDPINKFTNHFEQIRIFSDKKASVPVLLAEWNKVNSVDQMISADGVRFKLSGDKSMSIKIYIHRSNENSRFDISAGLRKVLPLIRFDPSELEVATALISYCQSRDLIDKKFVRCNEELQQVFGCESIPFSQFRNKLVEQLSACKPISVDYYLTTSGTIYPSKFNYSSFNRVSSRLFDIEIDVEDNAQTRSIALLNDLAIQCIELSDQVDKHELIDSYIYKRMNDILIRKNPSISQTGSAFFPLVVEDSTANDIAGLSGISNDLLVHIDPAIALHNRPIDAPVTATALSGERSLLSREVAVQSQLFGGRRFISEAEYHSTFSKRWKYDVESNNQSINEIKPVDRSINPNKHKYNVVAENESKAKLLESFMWSTLHNNRGFIHIGDSAIFPLDS